MTVDIGFANILVYLLVFGRMVGMILFNPMLSRQNVPSMVRMGLTLFLTFLVAPLQMAQSLETVYAMSTFAFVFSLVKEMVVGLAFGYIFQVFYYMLAFAGDLIDTDIGMSMAKTMDPNTNIQSAFSSSLITMMFSLYIFATNSHLALIRIFTESFAAIPLGEPVLRPGLITYLLQLFIDVFVLVLRLYAPFMVAAVSLQVCLGILMKFVPQVTVFVINFQLRIILGLIMLYGFAPFISQFIDKYIDTLFQSLGNAAQMLMG